ncbi:MAG: hypothetical protein M1825_000267 [Sarcosagium campestre]|nr:MAG: hypothetical protein M1825_000267 [Sarcosagium campestre]
MAARISDQQLGQAILHAARDGAYPESEGVISANLPSSAFTVATSLLSEAREDVKHEVEALSRDSASDVDSWISQAQKLQVDIERSKAIARDITGSAKGKSSSHSQLLDAESKYNLLKREVAFNATLCNTIGEIGTISQSLDAAAAALSSNSFDEAIGALGEAERSHARLGSFQTTTRVFEVLEALISRTRKALLEVLESTWSEHFSVDRIKHVITFKSRIRGSPELDLDVLTTALNSLQALESRIDRLFRDLDDVIVAPRLKVPTGQNGLAISAQNDGTLILSESSDSTSLEKTLEELKVLFSFLAARLPPAITVTLSESLVQSVAAKLINDWLEPSVPSSLDGIDEFESQIVAVMKFVGDVNALGWKRAGKLTEWTESAPPVWRTKRREHGLESARLVLTGGFGDTRVVERVETQSVAKDDSMFASPREDDWNAGWSDKEEDEDEDEVSAKAVQPEPADQDEDEDVSAWGFDGNEKGNNDAEKVVLPENPDADDVDADAWGWGDDDGDEGTKSEPAARSPKKPVRQNGLSKDSKSKREMTLREAYTITQIPGSILDIISGVLRDAETLSDPDLKSAIKPAAGGLFALPTHILAMFRALASSSYSTRDGGSMYLYNDSMWLADQLKIIQSEYAQKQPLGAAAKLKLGADIETLEGFGKRAFAKEMDSQRTVLGDILEGALGFSNCTVAPFAAECDVAVDSAIDRIREISSLWKGVLSRSALLQAIGSLVSTMTTKVVVDIEDMNDISEPESQRLAGFCNKISSLDDIFLPEPTPGSATNSAAAESVPLTAVYVPSWFKFRYLTNILESSLADIKYMWTEGELKLEFAAEEIVDLIEALFADSDYRRKAIGEIRRQSMNR